MSFIHSTAIIYDGVSIGDNVYIGPYSVIGAPAEHPDVLDPRHFKPELQTFIGNDVVIREFVTVHAGVNSPTIIDNGCYIMSHAHIGHDANVMHHVRLHGHCTIGGHSQVFPYARIGMGAMLHQHTLIPRGTMVGANAFVKGKWEEEYRMLAGVPAKDIGPNFRLLDKIKRGEIIIR